MWNFWWRCHTQVMLKILIVLMHNDFVHGNALLVAGLNVTIEFAQHNRPQRWQWQIEQVAKFKNGLIKIQLEN